MDKLFDLSVLDKGGEGVRQIVNMPLPDECVDGVVFNLRLLKQHIETMRQEAGDTQ